ncbi:hypothetical protein [Novosphingobium guangzhouense]|uniref:Chemotaxis methyl-accepting receptor HlyB-like 4HB MCP domain-containing protein n=1 Tax=Novosphingobium guangzhouense TaxID=1850347 RepID=A0A2K2FTJ4_9SPHN|nr:hypothetical protein [Novosphingobium guangzhouense]PNU02096.1 hypothetical protein A8V01_26900 [Novosphingobium guangzhouense]
MASAAPSSPWLTPDRAKRYLKLILGGFATAAVGGLLAAWFTYLFTAKLNSEAMLQQQYLAAVQEFIVTGSKVDASVTELSDSILDKEGVREGRKEARQAIAAHVAATQSLAQVIGTGNADAYMEGLATLRTLVDEAADVQTALKASRARFDLMDNRAVIVAEARRRIYGHT